MLKWIIALCMAITTTLSAQINVLAFAGSTREASVNKKLANEAAKIARQMNANVTVIDLKDYQMPFYDEDLEKQGMPEKAKEFRRLMLKNDIIIIASPEYNGSLSGVLKNTIDWASRTENGQASREAFQGKKFVIMAAFPGGGGGARGLVHLRKILENLGGIVVTQQVIVPDAFNAFDAQGNLKNTQMKKELQDEIRAAIN